jgi:hypothetical protein
LAGVFGYFFNDILKKETSHEAYKEALASFGTEITHLREKAQEADVLARVSQDRSEEAAKTAQSNRNETQRLLTEAQATLVSANRGTRKNSRRVSA